jgi:tetratricopeptide (TPR) repeat protein
MTRSVPFALIFVLGMAAGALAAKVRLDPSAFVGKSPEVAAAALLDTARSMTGPKDSWENIAIGRILYLSGNKTEGQKIFDAVTDRKEVGSDYLRIGRVYVEAGEWGNAKRAFDRALELEPKDAPWMAEIGAYQMIHGEREQGEELFRRSAAIEGGNFWSIVNMAAGYHGVRPQ